MKNSRYIVIALVAIVALVVVAMILVSKPRSREVKMADGSVLRLEKVSFGKREPFKPGGWWRRTKEQIAARLPKKWADKIVRPSTNGKSSWSGGSAFQARTNEPALNVWFTRINSANGNYENVGLMTAVIEDDDGCEFSQVAAGGEDNGLLASVAATTGGGGGSFGSSGFGSGGFGPGGGGGGSSGSAVRAGPRSSVTWFTFEVFPRRQKEFKMRVYDISRQLVAEFVVPNPAPIPPAPRTPIPSLPVSVTNGNVVFTVANAVISPKAASISPPYVPGGVDFKFDCSEDGKPSTNWDAVGMELRDSSGNWAPTSVNYPYALCPDEPAWKLQVKFSAREDASNRTWTIRGLAVPEAGTVLQLETNATVDGVSITLLGMGGAGQTTYSSGATLYSTLSSSRRSGEAISVSGIRGGSSGSSAYMSVTMQNPHLVVILGEIGEDQRITVKITADQARQYYVREVPFGPSSARGARRGGSYFTDGIGYLAPLPRNARGRAGAGQTDIRFMDLGPPPDAKTVDVTFCVHRTHEVEFIFKPPGKDKR